jgi:VWFA-related protein
MQLRAVLYCSLAVSTLAISPLAQSTAPAEPSSSSTEASIPAQEAPGLESRTPDQQPTLTIRQTVRRVVVDVMVRDASGKPVHGLTAGDFTVKEDHHPERVLSFDVYDFDKPSISRGPNAPPLPPNLFLNVPTVPEHGPLYVILYDMVNMEKEDQMTARPQILKFIKNAPAGTRFAVFVNSDEVYLAQGFTTDKDLLYACLDSKHARPHVPKIFLNGRSYGMGDPYTVMDVMTHIGQYLDGIPGRKNLIWVSGRFPAAVFPREGDPVDAQDDIRQEMTTLAQAQVAVFPVSVRGVVVACEGCMTGAMPNGGAGGQEVSLPPGQAAPNALSSPTASPVVSGMQVAGKGTGSLVEDNATEDEIASETGGRAFYSDNSVSALLEQATEDGGNYYTLTYSPSSSSDDGKCHGISVEVAGGKYQLSYRRSYCRAPLVSTASDDAVAKSSGPTLTVPTQAGDVLQGNMKQGAPMVHDLIFSAHVRTEGGVVLANSEEMAHLQEQAQLMQARRKNKPPKPLPPAKVQKYTVEYRVFDPQFKAQAARTGRQPTLEFAIAAFDADGKMINGMVNDAVLESPAGADRNKSGLYRAHQSLVVPLNAVSIRVGVRDRISDRMGTLEVPLPLKPEPVAQMSGPH